MSFLEILSEPFMLRAIYGGLLIASLCACLGVFVTLRKQSFLADGLAHASLAGVAIGLVLSFQPLVLAGAVAVFMAVSITYLRRRLKLSFDSAIGILYTMLFALGVVIINLSPAFRPELFSYLFGSLLAITWSDVLVAFVLFIIVSVFLAYKYTQLVYSTFDPESAQIRGINVVLLEYMLNIITSLVIVVAIKLLGVILVTALLVVPATSAKLLARNFRQMIPISLTHALLATLLGIIISYYLETVPGATIVLTAGGLLAIVFLFARKQ